MGRSTIDEAHVPDDVWAALKRSRARRIVLASVAGYSTPMYAAQIARLTGLDHPTVLAALRGLGKRHAPGASLTGLGLMDQLAATPRTGYLRTYRVTDLGRRVARRCAPASTQAPALRR